MVKGMLVPKFTAIEIFLFVTSLITDNHRERCTSLAVDSEVKLIDIGIILSLFVTFSFFTPSLYEILEKI